MTMRTVQMTGYGDADVLVLADVPKQAAAPGEIRIRVRAAAVNPADPKWRQGMFRSFAPVSFPHVLGYDVAGEIDQVGVDVTGLQAGDRVVVMLNALTKGGYAEYAIAPAASVLRIPDALDFATAAALPTAGLTGVQMVEEHARLASGQIVLITGATGSVGRFATFAARRAGAQVVAAVRAEQAEVARAIGAEAVLALGEEEWAGAPFDQVIDTVGGSEVAKLCRRVKPGGSIFTASTTPIDKDGLATDPIFVIVHDDTAMLAKLAAAVVSGELAVPVAMRLPLESAQHAHRLLERGGMGGKVILEP